jgi:hypothetical protein
MAHPWFLHGEDGLQIWRVAVNLLNKQSANKGGGPAAWELGEGLTTPDCKKKLVTKCYAGTLCQYY